MKIKKVVYHFIIYGDLKNNNKPLILVALVDNNHYQLINYNNSILSFDYVALLGSNTNINNNENVEPDYYYNLNKYFKNTLLMKAKKDYQFYPGYNNGEIFYKDISEYLKSTITNLKNNNNNTKKCWPKFIEEIKGNKDRENKKRLFRLKSSKFIYFKDTLYIKKNVDYTELNNNIISLIIKGNDDEITDIIKKNNKIYRVSKLFECIYLMKKFILLQIIGVMIPLLKNSKQKKFIERV